MDKVKTVTIQGISPLLMNRPNMMEIEDKAKIKQSGVDELTRQFNIKQYLTDDGKLFAPDTHIKGSMVEAGKNIKVRLKGKSTYSKIIGYSVRIEPAQILHKKTKLERYTVLAVNPNTKGRNAVCRPMLKEWELDFNVVFDDEEIPAEVVKEALDYAGKKVGIGDWRPAKKGTFGRFIVTRFK